ncbi:uroporphyrin-III C-methyltransferase [compost metagenome]
MGMRKLVEIARVYKDAGLGDMPAAIIQHASLPQQKKVVCRTQDLPAAAAGAGLTYPAIVVIGKVVGIAHEIA